MDAKLECPELWIDVRIDPAKLQKIDVLLGPCVTEEERKRVESVMRWKLNRTNYRISQFTGQMDDWGYMEAAKYFIYTDKWGDKTPMKLITKGHDTNHFMQNVAVLQELAGRHRVLVVPMIDLESKDYCACDPSEARKLSVAKR